MKLRFCRSKVGDYQQFHMFWKSNKYKCVLNFPSNTEQWLCSRKGSREKPKSYSDPLIIH